MELTTKRIVIIGDNSFLDQYGAAKLQEKQPIYIFVPCHYDYNNLTMGAQLMEQAQRQSVEAQTAFYVGLHRTINWYPAHWHKLGN